MAKINEKDVLLDHNYDGIQELDNDLPPWWLWMFYVHLVVLYTISGYCLSMPTSTSDCVDLKIKQGSEG